MNEVTSGTPTSDGSGQESETPSLRSRALDVLIAIAENTAFGEGLRVQAASAVLAHLIETLR